VCGPPAIPANSRVTTKTTDYGIGEAKYECDTGYELFGQDTVRCDAKKGWDKEMPFCGEFFKCLTIRSPPVMSNKNSVSFHF
jgi:Sushi repeat (SCR repeat)